MTISDCLERGSLNICLAEAHFGNSELWFRAPEGTGEERGDANNQHWLDLDDRLALSHLLFMIAWHGVRCVPSFVRVLFGMSEEVRCEFERTSVAALWPLARSRSTWIYPRWALRGDVWSSLLEDPTGQTDVSLSPTLRLLQACASESAPMRSCTFVGSLDADQPELTHQPQPAVSNTAARTAARRKPR
jgi:hypothetical protein